jgi:hypothetical protein
VWDVLKSEERTLEDEDKYVDEYAAIQACIQGMKRSGAGD